VEVKIKTDMKLMMKEIFIAMHNLGGHVTIKQAGTSGSL
jgi:hypothetical protein